MRRLLVISPRLRRVSLWLIWLLVVLLLVGYTIPALRVETLNPRLRQGFGGQAYQELYEDLLYPSVRITAGSSTGSGVVIYSSEHVPPSGTGVGSSETPNSELRTPNSIYILTAAHVVGNEASVLVTFYDYRDVAQIETASVVITDTLKDLALIQLRIANCEWRIYKAKLAPKDYKPYLFSPVWTVGCSLGLPPRPSFGHITSIGNNSEIRNPKSEIGYWETSAPIVPGNSGGGVFLQSNHQLIGIAIWVRTYKGQLITTMAGIVPLQDIYEFLKKSPEGVPRMGDQVSNCW